MVLWVGRRDADWTGRPRKERPSLWFIIGCAVAVTTCLGGHAANAQHYDPRNPPTVDQSLQRTAVENFDWVATDQFAEAHWGIYGQCRGDTRFSYYHDEIGISSIMAGSRVNRVSRMYRAGDRYLYVFAGTVEVVEFGRDDVRTISPITGAVTGRWPKCAVSQEPGRWPANQSRHPLYTGAASDAVITAPRWLRAPRPEFPDRARSQGIRSGRVTLMCDISQLGVPSDCEILSETPAGYGFGPAAVLAARRAAATRSDAPYRLRFSVAFAD